MSARCAHDCAMRLLACALLCAAAPVLGQTVGPASFRVYEKGVEVGTITMSLDRSPDGWRLHGTSHVTGATPTTIVNLDLHYDHAWHARFMTLEMKAPDDAIVHVAVVGDTTRTDIVRPTEARFRSNSVSPDTIFLPDRAYGAYEAVAARLAAGPVDLPLYIPPFGETRASVEDVVTEAVAIEGGTITATRYTLLEIRERPTRVELWVVGGRLLRVDFPRAGISVIRTDVQR